MTADELAQSETIPKVCIVGAPQGAGHISVRYSRRSRGIDRWPCPAAVAWRQRR